MPDLNLSDKKIKGFVIVLLSLIFLTGCSRETGRDFVEQAKDSRFYDVYYINTAGTKIQSVSYETSTKDMEEVVGELIDLLSRPSDEIGLRQAIPDEIGELTFDISEDLINIHFNEAYNVLTGVSEVLRRAAVVKTLCQIQGIKYVKYTVGGQPLLYSDMTPVGVMKADDFIDNTSGETTYYQTVHLTLYYTNEAGNRLLSARHHVEFDGTISLENLILKQLVNGPLVEEKLYPVMPEGTKVNKVSSKDGICYIDFSKEFLKGVDGVANQVVVYSIVNSLSEVGSVTKVIITVDGESISLYRGEVPLDIPLERKLEIIETK